MKQLTSAQVRQMWLDFWKSKVTLLSQQTWFL